MPIGLLRVAEARARHLDGRRQGVDCGILAENHRFQVAVEVGERAAVVRRHAPRRDARDFRDDLLDLGLADDLFLLGLGRDALGGAGLVDHVDRLIGQVPVVDVARGKLRGRGERVGGVLDAVVRLEARLEPLQDLDGFVDRRLDHVDLLEAARQRVVLLEHAAVLVVGGGADAFQLPRRQHGLEQVRGIERPAGGGAGADHRVDFVDEKNRVRIVDQLLQHGLQPLLEVSPVFRAGEERAHVERVHRALGEEVRHAAFDDPAREPFGDRRLAHARLTDEKRIVLAAPAERLHNALELLIAADQRVDLAGEGERVQVLSVVVERAVGGSVWLSCSASWSALLPCACGSW